MTNPIDVQERWSEQRANDWWAARPWMCGFNYLPASAVNFLEMWSRDTFDRDGIDRELGWAAEAGFNAVRTNLHYLVWQQDAEDLAERFDWFLATAARHGIVTMPVFFDDCGFGGFEPIYGKQPEPLPNRHNSRAVASPGRANVMDRSLWPDYKRYVQDLMARHRDDDRILLWDLYNEPGNGMIFTADGGFAEYDRALAAHSRDLMLAAFAWSREINPSQPITVGAWRTELPESAARSYDNEIDQLALAHSDIITFHAYCSRQEAVDFIAEFKQFNRPIMSTEWLARIIGSRFLDQLDVYRDNKVGCFNWGLVAGRTQTNRPWPADLVARHGKVIDPEIWFHDVLRADGSAYDPAETAMISSYTRELPNAIVRNQPCPV